MWIELMLVKANLRPEEFARKTGFDLARLDVLLRDDDVPNVDEMLELCIGLDAFIDPPVLDG